MKKIIFFTSETWPHCTSAKVYLQNKGYPFEEKDLNKDMDARREFSSRGFQGVPAFIIGDESVVGLDTRKIESLMENELVTCPECNSRLRLPSGKGKIRVTCPKCGNLFTIKT